VVIVNPNNPNGGVFDIDSLPELLNKYPDTYFLVDEAFIGFAGNTAIPMIHRHSNLIVTRTFSKAHSLAGFRIGYAVLPKRLADDLNTHNDAYPLARPSQAAALATLLHEDEIKLRITELRKWTEDLRACLNRLGVRTFPTQTYFFLADFSPFDAEILAAHLHEYQILVKPLNLPRLGKGFMRITTALPEDNKRFLNVLERILNAKR
jgi:histidinol-phosphate aminotransferase